MTLLLPEAVSQIFMQQDWEPIGTLVFSFILSLGMSEMALLVPSCHTWILVKHPLALCLNTMGEHHFSVCRVSKTTYCNANQSFPKPKQQVELQSKTKQVFLLWEIAVFVTLFPIKMTSDDRPCALTMGFDTSVYIDLMTIWIVSRVFQG